MKNQQAQKDKKILGMSRNVFFTGLTSFLTDTSTKMVYSVMSLFLLSIGATKSMVGLIEGVAESTASLLKALSGFWSDKIGRNKPFMVIGYFMTAMITPLYAAVTAPFQVLIFRFTERLGKGVRTAPRDSLIAGSTEGKNIGRYFGFHKAMDNCGAIVGPLLAYGILVLLGQKGQKIDPEICKKIFLIASIPAFLGVFTIIFFIKEARKNKDDLLKRFSFRDFPVRYYFFLGIVFIFTLGNSADTFLLIKANDAGIAARNIPLAYLLFNFMSVLFAVPMGILSDKIGRERLIILGYFIYSVVYFGFGRTNVKLAIVLLLMLYGLYSAATDGIQKAFVSDLIGKNKKGTGLGIYNSVIGITLLPASIIAGMLYDKVNSGAPFYFGAVTAVISALLMTGLYLFRRSFKA